MIRHVIPADDAESWNRTLEQYLADWPHSTGTTPLDDEDDDEDEEEEEEQEEEDKGEREPPPTPPPRNVFWSLAQLRARAHPNTLAVQRFLMSHAWHDRHGRGHGLGAAATRLSAAHPVTYADRVWATTSGGRPDAADSSSPLRAAGTGETAAAAAAYRAIWAGRWEEHDPWDAPARLGEDEDEDDGGGDDDESSVFRMFDGVLPLSINPETPAVMRTCPLPLRLATAYRLLRPFFAPKRSPAAAGEESFLSPSNWALLDAAQRPEWRASAPHRPRGDEGQDDSAASQNPHLRLEETLVPLPRLAPGDYVVWHPDVICSTPPACTTEGCVSGPSTTTLLCLPACPLTRPNAAFLARQRRAFVLGFPGPDFSTTTTSAHARDFSFSLVGESYHLSRPGTQDIFEAGGEEALQAMGLLAWEEQREEDGELIEMANRILFPDRAGRWKGG